MLIHERPMANIQLRLAMSSLYKKFWEELLACFPFMRHGLTENKKKNSEGDTHTPRQYGGHISLPTKTMGRDTQTAW
jgi:hypothetical protein